MSPEITGQPGQTSSIEVDPSKIKELAIKYVKPYDLEKLGIDYIKLPEIDRKSTLVLALDDDKNILGAIHFPDVDPRKTIWEPELEKEAIDEAKKVFGYSEE